MGQPIVSMTCSACSISSRSITVSPMRESGLGLLAIRNLPRHCNDLPERVGGGVEPGFALLFAHEFPIVPIDLLWRVTGVERGARYVPSSRYGVRNIAVPETIFRERERRSG